MNSESNTTNNDLILFEGRLKAVSADDSHLEFDGRVLLRWALGPSLVVEGTCERENEMLPYWEPERIEVPEIGIMGPILELTDVSITMIPGASPTRIFCRMKSLERIADTSLSSVDFAVPNFHWMVGGGPGNLLGDSWTVELHPVPDLMRVVSQLRHEGGFAVTHLGHLRRVDSERFSIVEARRILEGVHFFLSFCRGFWTGPVVLKGSNNVDEVIWERWQIPRLDPWRFRYSWLQSGRPSPMAEAFRSWMELWSDPLWEATLRMTVGRYLTANGEDAIENGIVTAQSALEMIGWSRLVESEGKHSRGAWKKRLSAQDKLVSVLNSSGIDPEIPSSLTGLVTLANKNGWDCEGPSVLPRIRNHLVHPRRREGTFELPTEALADAWSLSVWYLELCLLRVLGVVSPFANRLDLPMALGKESPPPWVT